MSEILYPYIIDVMVTGRQTLIREKLLLLLSLLLLIVYTSKYGVIRRSAVAAVVELNSVYYLFFLSFLILFFHIISVRTHTHSSSAFYLARAAAPARTLLLDADDADPNAAPADF